MSHVVVPTETLCIDVQELRLIERVDQVCPELETRRATETHVLRHGEVPLVTAGQAERRDRRVAILTVQAMVRTLRG